MSYFAFSPTVLRSLFSRPATRLYPKQKREPYANTRGSIGINVSACIFCGLCERRCPTQAIQVSKPDKTWKIERMRCIACDACVEVCPKKCLTTLSRYSPSATAKTGPDTFKQ